jgi:histone acetyltransferase (RNA polymerase elongator complex component)
MDGITRRAKHFVIPVFIPHKGCAHRCTFCNQNFVTGAAAALPDETEITRTTKQYLKFKRTNRGFTEISFFGGNFLGLGSADIRRLLDAAADFVSAGKINGIRFSTRPDTIDKKRLEIMSNYPVTTVELGVQSMDDRVLKKVKRGHSAADTRLAVQRLKTAGYTLGCQIMTGLPGEDQASSLDTARAVAALGPDFVRIYPLVVLNKSPLAADYRAGRFAPLDLEAGVLRTKKLFQIFSHAGINVIRMGLQASEGLDNPGAILAGPYHPAFGHMVFASLMYDHAENLLDAAKNHPDTVVLNVHPGSISRMQGLAKSNLKKLHLRYPGVKKFEIRPDPNLNTHEIRLDL